MFVFESYDKMLDCKFILNFGEELKNRINIYTMIMYSITTKLFSVLFLSRSVHLRDLTENKLSDYWWQWYTSKTSSMNNDQQLKAKQKLNIGILEF